MNKNRIALDSLKMSLDGKTTSLIISSVLLLTLQYYHRLTPWLALDLVVFCLIAPLIIILVFWRENPASYGLRLGNWKLGLLFTAGGIALMTSILWFATRTQAFQVYYGGSTLAWSWLALDNMVHLFSWEFFFRGFLLFGLARRYGDNAIWLQAVPFAIAHFSKPEVETLSTIFGGAALIVTEA